MRFTKEKVEKSKTHPAKTRSAPVALSVSASRDVLYRRTLGNQYLASLHDHRSAQNPLQLEARSLGIGALGDRSEQEADRVADQIMQIPEPRGQCRCACGGIVGPDGECVKCRAKRLQRTPVGVRSMVNAPPSVDETLSKPGQPLYPSTRESMETRFGVDFSLVLDSLEVVPPSDEATGFEYDFSQMLVHDSGQRGIQPKLRVGSPGDKYEREADQIANRVVWMKLSESGSSTETRSHSALQNKETQIQPGSSLGKPLDASTSEEMSRKFGVNLSGVRVHTGEPAVYLNKRLNARAFTYGSDIFFDKGEYNPHSSSGKKLLAHEITHVVQQSRMGNSTQQKMIQCTTIGEILDEFFSPFSSETLWVMPESDNYTRKVRRWQPVIDAVNQAKGDLEANCADWSSNHRTDSSWTPGKTDPPVTDPNAHGIWVSSPPGTDPATCRNAFIIYVNSKANPFSPTIQTFELYTCSIGSFGIYATVDSNDCAAKTAEMNIWMYNAMDQASFGRYASHPLFSASGMERQYMWWNWKESHSWGSAAAPGGGSGGGSSDW